METGLGPRGLRLWQSFLSQDAGLNDEENPMREVALSACRTADRVDELEEECSTSEPTLAGRTGQITNPAYVEVRQQALTLARLIAALRLPDEATGKKPQHRQARGVQQPRKLSAAERMAARTGTA